MPIVAFTVTALVAYVLGATPTGYLVARSRGVDIRSTGSGNIGATNVLRTLGVAAGVLVLLGDAVKGAVPVLLVRTFAPRWLPSVPPAQLEWLALCAGLCAVLGHVYTFWLGFKGGKGIATSGGVLAALVPGPFLVVLTVFLLVALVSRYVSLASVVAAAVLPFATWLFGRGIPLIVVTAIMAALAIYKHKENMKRLLQGTERRIGRRPPSPPESTPAT